MSVRVKISFCELSEGSAVGPMDEIGVGEGAAELDETRLHLSPRLTHLKHGTASSHCWESA